MFRLKKNLVYILLFSLLCIIIPSANSYVADLYNGRVKYGSYHCVKNGETCDFERYESSSSMSGKACPPLDKNMTMEVRSKIEADFLNSKYCSFTPTKVKKYNCKYDDGSATVFIKEGKVISASHSPQLRRPNMQDLYIPNKCTEEKMQGDNGEPPVQEIIRNRNNPFDKNSKYTTHENYMVSNYNSYYKYQMDFVKDTVKQSVTKETETYNKKIKSLQKEVESLKTEINTLKNQSDSHEQYLNFQTIFLIVIFIIELIALIRSNRNPYNRL